MRKKILNTIHSKNIMIWSMLLMLLPVSLTAQTRRALLVGISDYKSSPIATGWENIHGADDVRMMQETLDGRGFADIVTLLDSGATHDRIVKELDALAGRTNSGDTVVFLFSGHGQPFEDLDGDEGKDDGWDESIVPYDAPMFYTKGVYEGEHHITDDQLHELMLHLRRAAGPQGMMYVLLDACYSGSGMRGDEDDEEPTTEKHRSIVGFCVTRYRPFTPVRTRSSHRELEAIAGCAPIIALEAAMPHQRNREIKVGDRFYGPLCYYVAEVLKQQGISMGHTWIEEVIKRYRADRRLYKQGLYCEYTQGLLKQ